LLHDAVEQACLPGPVVDAITSLGLAPPAGIAVMFAIAAQV